MTNLDYLSFGNEPETQSQPQTNGRASKPVKTEPGPTDWEKLIGSLDNNQGDIYDAYSSAVVDGILDLAPLGMSHHNHSAHTLNELTFTPDLWALAPTESNGSDNSIFNTTSSGQTDSLLSFSTDERDVNSSNEDFTTADWMNSSGHLPVTTSSDAYRGICMPELGHDELNFGNSWEAPLSLE